MLAFIAGPNVVVHPVCEFVSVEIPCHDLASFLHPKMSSYLRVMATLRNLSFEHIVVWYIKVILVIKHVVL